MSRLYVAIVLGLAGASELACGGAIASGPSDPVVQSLEVSSEAIEGALQSAREAAEEQELVVFRARYNPAPACQCPEWEIELRGRWTRVFFEPPTEDSPILSEIDRQAQAEIDAGLYGHWIATGSLSEDWRPDEVSGLSYPVLLLRSAEPAPGPGL